MEKLIPKWVFYSGIIILGLYLLVRLLDSAQMINFFPLARPGDIPMYMGYLYLLKDVGFHNVVPYWFGGSMVLFQLYPPGFFYATFPIYLLTNSVEFSTYIMIPILYIIIFITFMFFAIKEKISKLKMTFFYLILMANPIAIGNFIRLGRVVELFAWTFMIIIFFLFIYYFNRPLNKYFYLIFIPSYTILLISHPAIITLFHLCMLPVSFFFLIGKKDKLFFMLSVALGLLFSAFWWVPFLVTVMNGSSMFATPFSLELLRFDTLSYVLSNIASILISLTMFVMFYFYWYYSGKNRRVLYLFLPILILNFLVLTRLVVFIPVLNNIFCDIYNIFFIFFLMLFFVRIPFVKLKRSFVTIAKYCLFLIPILFVIFSVFYTPFFIIYTPMEYEVISFLPQVEGSFFMLKGSSATSHTPYYYIYGMIYNNLSTPYGSYTYGSVDNNYRYSLSVFQEASDNNDCDLLANSLERFDVTSLIAFYEDDCEFLESCGMNLKVDGEYACLYVKDSMD